MGRQPPPRTQTLPLAPTTAPAAIPLPLAPATPPEVINPVLIIPPADQPAPEPATVEQFEAHLTALAREQADEPAGEAAGVYALRHFECALTKRGYRPGDQVVGWTAERAQHYAGLGLVRIVEE